MSCRYVGISRQAHFLWYRRCQAEGINGLRTRSKRPKTGRPHQAPFREQCGRGQRWTHVVVGEVTPDV